jgi:hypothetical protein
LAPKGRCSYPELKEEPIIESFQKRCKCFVLKKAACTAKNGVQAAFYGLNGRLFISPPFKVSDCCNTANNVTLSPILPTGII